jgi:uncharacterized protein YcbX
MGLQGEQLDLAVVSERGVVGDRQFALKDILTGKVIDPVKFGYDWGETKAAPSVLEIAARYSKDPIPRLEVVFPDGGAAVTSPQEIERKVHSFLGREVRLAASPEIMTEKVKKGRTIHILTNSSLDKMKLHYPEGDFDVRRFRPNIVVEGEGPPDFIEEKWTGKSILVGVSMKLRVEEPNERCAVTTMKQGALRSDPGVLQTISRVNRSNLGVMCAVETPGDVKVGDALSLLSS